MHADEAVQAARLDDIRYDPSDRHGTVLPWVTRLTGVASFAEATEFRLRIIPAVAGTALAAVLPLPAAAFTAVSPALRYYSRDYIPEILLVLWTVLMLHSGRRYVRSPDVRLAALTGALAGLAYATKETAVIAVVCALAAGGRRTLDIPMRHWAAAALSAAVVAAALLTPTGFVSSWSAAAQAANPKHFHSPLFYLERLFLTEWPLLLLALLASFRNTAPFLARWTALVFLAYCLIPYKTPWCALTPLIGFVSLSATVASRPVLAIACLILALTPAAPTWSYAETTPDVFTARAALDPLPRDTHIDVIGRDLWPLPWYLRDFKNVHWWTAVPNRALSPVVLAPPSYEPDLIRAMYELPPPGQRSIYTHLFPGRVLLRNDLELRGYIKPALP
jgi:predicted membrane-bound mannosyltransferase